VEKENIYNKKYCENLLLLWIAECLKLLFNFGDSSIKGKAIV